MSKKLFFSLTLILVLILVVCLLVLNGRQKTLPQPPNTIQTQNLTTGGESEGSEEATELESIQVDDFEAELLELQNEADTL